MADLLEQLEQEFGLREVQTEEITLYGHKWTLRKLDYDDVDKANQFIFRRSEDDEDTDGVEPLVLGFRSSLAFIAVSLSAIDDQPACFVFKTATAEEIAPFSPLTPPTKVRHKTAERVHRFFSSSRKNMELIMQLYDVYTEKLDDRLLGRKKEKEDAAAKEGEAKDAATATGGAGAAPTNPLTASGPSPTDSAG